MMVEMLAQGDLLVTGCGHVIVDCIIPRSRALLIQPENYITVEFDPHEPAPPPCNTGEPDELKWELFFHHAHDEQRHHDYHHAGAEEELRLRIMWHVNEARTIIWRIKVPS